MCNESGSDVSARGSCNATTGQCTCKENVEGVKCTSCKTSFFNLQLSNPTGCEGVYVWNESYLGIFWVYKSCSNLVACNCSSNGSTALSKGACDATGQCVCKEGVTGVKCSVCEVRR